MKVSDIDSIGVRMPSELKAWVKETAKKNRRTMNNQIVCILEKEKALRAPTPKALVETHND